MGQCWWHAVFTIKVNLLFSNIWLLWSVYSIVEVPIPFCQCCIHFYNVQSSPEQSSNHPVLHSFVVDSGIVACCGSAQHVELSSTGPCLSSLSVTLAQFTTIPSGDGQVVIKGHVGLVVAALISICNWLHNGSSHAPFHSFRPVSSTFSSIDMELPTLSISSVHVSPLHQVAPFSCSTAGAMPCTYLSVLHSLTRIHNSTSLLISMYGTELRCSWILL